MNRVILLVLVFCFVSCSKSPTTKDDTCVNKEAKQNISGQRLPVAISYIMPNAWLETQRSNSMVFEERIIDPLSQAKLKVFYFEGMRDQVDANLQRWKNQFKEEARKLILEETKIINEIPVVEFRMSGSYIDKLQPMNPDSEAVIRANHEMRALIVETQTGTWFFKAVAPSNVMNIQASNFDNFFNTIKETY